MSRDDLLIQVIAVSMGVRAVHIEGYNAYEMSDEQLDAERQKAEIK